VYDAPVAVINASSWDAGTLPVVHLVASWNDPLLGDFHMFGVNTTI